MKALLDCHHCGNTGVSFLRKMCMGPAIPTTCKSCCKKVGVPYSAMSTVIPFIVAVQAARAVGSVAFGVVIVLGGIIAMSYIHMCCIPLEPR